MCYLDKIVALSEKHRASDLHFSSGCLPWWRCSGVLMPIPDQPMLQPGTLQALSEHYLNQTQLNQLTTTGHVDFALTVNADQRLRGNLFQQQRGLSLALRVIAKRCPMPAELNLPDTLLLLLQQPDGLILFTGATGSGKSTSMAAMVNFINHRQAKHILTLEDPIELIHVSQQSLIQQREIGQHSSSFAGGLKAALREDPDIILLGELRDSETIRLALTAAETGHLVLATLHTRGAAQAIMRLIDGFHAEQKAVISAMLANSLKAVIAQRLEVDGKGGRVGLFEILVNTPAAASLIREGKSHQLASLIQTGASCGMQTFAQSRRKLEESGILMPQYGETT